MQSWNITFEPFVHYIQNDWAKGLPGAKFAGNNASSSTTLAFFFLVNYSQHPCMRFEPTECLLSNLTSETRTKLIAANRFVGQMQELQLHLQDQMLIAQTIYESWANKRKRPCLCYFVQDKVWLNTRNIQTARPAAKLDD